MRLNLPFPVLSCVYLLCFIQALAAQDALTNITIDDMYGDPETGAQFVYTPSDFWNVGQNCNSCAAQPSPSQAYQGTWHDGSPYTPSSDGEQSGLLSAEISFFGSAIYVFCILAQTITPLNGSSDMSFYIDDELVGTYVHAPTAQPLSYDYNVPVYVNESLPSAPHKFSLVGGRTGSTSLILFDYIVYSRAIESVKSSRVIEPVNTSSSPSASSDPPSVSSSSTMSKPLSLLASDSRTTSSTVQQSLTSSLLASDSRTTFSTSQRSLTTSETTFSIVQPTHTTSALASSSTSAPIAQPTNTASHSSAPIVTPTHTTSRPSAKIRTTIVSVATVGGILLLLTIVAVFLWARQRYHRIRTGELLHIGGAVEKAQPSVEVLSVGKTSAPHPSAMADSITPRTSIFSPPLSRSNSGTSLSCVATVGADLPNNGVDGVYPCDHPVASAPAAGATMRNVGVVSWMNTSSLTLADSAESVPPPYTERMT
ncbi:hypothetical protein A0H81_00334 [Grifola frondosa]|uniref:Uncharacterized protein n=1 Tax=Grifola frondosa TaxID=5627 RepID=A0A1C7MS99_GRIFR|nr:hypothetical protein A0H81_00334 [Grifola frondosa]